MALDGFSALVGGIAAATVKTVVARAATPAILSFGSRQISNISRNWRLPENHDAQKALRTAQHEAILNTLADFENWAAEDPSTQLDETELAFVRTARSVALDGKRNASKVEKHLNDVAYQKTAKSLDLALAGKLGIDERADALRLAASDAVLDELAKAASRKGTKTIPPRFRAVFLGEYVHIEGWHPRFVVYASQALKEKPAYRDIFVAEKLCVLADSLQGLHDKVDAGFSSTDAQLNDIRGQLAQLIAREENIPIDNLRPLFAAVGRDVPEAGFERAVREAVAELLKRAAVKPQSFNDPEEIARAILVAREKLSRLDTDGAVDHLRTVRAEQAAMREERQRGEARLAREEADILKLAYRFDEAIAAFEVAGTLNPEDAWAWFHAGDIHRHRGRLAKALAAYEAGRTAAEKSGNERNLSISFNRIGDVRRSQGDLSGSLKACQDGLAIHEKLAAWDPGNTESQRDLSVSLNKIGDIRRSQGDLSGALKAYQDSSTIFEKLANQDPGNAGWQRDLSVSFDRIGDVRISQGDLTGALKAYQDGLAVAEKLATQDPGNAQWQHDLSVSFEKIGNVRRSQGDLTGALKAYQDGLAVREKLASQDPGNTGWQRDLSVSLQRIGEVRSSQGDLSGALMAYQDGLAIHQMLAVQDPGNAQWQRDLSVSFDRIGDVRRSQGNLSGALKAYQDGLAVREKLAAQDPGNAEWQRDLSVSFSKIGGVRFSQGDVTGALKAYQDDLALAEKLAAQDLGNAQWQRDLIVSNWQLAEIGDRPVERYAAALAIATSLAKSGRLVQVDKYMIEKLEKLLAEARGE